MSYTPTNWTTGDTITATKLNKLENGVANAGGSGIGIDAVIYTKNGSYHIVGDFDSALAKAQEGIPIIAYEASYESGSGWYRSYLASSFPCYYSESYPNRIDIQITGGVGWYWTANGIDYYD